MHDLDHLTGDWVLLLDAEGTESTLCGAEDLAMQIAAEPHLRHVLTLHGVTWGQAKRIKDLAMEHGLAHRPPRVDPPRRLGIIARAVVLAAIGLWLYRMSNDGFTVAGVVICFLGLVLVVCSAILEEARR